MSRKSQEEALIGGAVKRTRQTITLVDAKALIRTWLAGVANEVSRGRKVLVPGFGVFYKKKSKARQVRDVYSGKLVILPATRKLGFRAASAQKWGAL